MAFWTGGPTTHAKHFYRQSIYIYENHYNHIALININYYFIILGKTLCNATLPPPIRPNQPHKTPMSYSINQLEC